MARETDDDVRRQAELRLEAMFRRHYHAVASYVSRRADQDVVDDVVADTFLVAWRRLKDVPEEELPWLLAVASHTLSTQRRSSTRRESLLRKLGGLGAPSEVWPATDSFDEVSQALGELSAADREAITLIAWDGLTPREAAKVVGQPAAAFRVRLHRVKRRLRSRLERRTPAAEQPNPPRGEEFSLTGISASKGGLFR